MYLPSTDSRLVIEAVDRLGPGPEDVVLLLVGEEDRTDVEDLISCLTARKLRFFGGVFPGLISGGERFGHGAVVKVLPAVCEPILIESLSEAPIAIGDLAGQMAGEGESKHTAFILVDGLTSNISSFLQELFNRLGDTVHYFGGGAGSLSLKQEPCVFTSRGLVADAAVVAFIRLESHLGVRHGWRKLTGPVVATKTRRNVIIELNWRKAFDVYKEAVERDSELELTAESFFEVAKGYPFGMYKEGAEDIVRDPIAVTEGGELVCVGEVPENTVLNILKGESRYLIEAAGQAADDCAAVRGRRIRETMVVDCISRALFLEEDFTKELSTVDSKLRALAEGVVPEGVLTLGEISSYGDGFVEFFNKTTVAGAFYD